MSHRAVSEETQKLLGVGADGDSGDEELLLSSAPPPQSMPPPAAASSQQIIAEPPPLYTPPAPAGPVATAPPPVNPQPPPPGPVAPAQIPVTITEAKPFTTVLGAPPEYTYHVPPTHHAAVMPAATAGLPVQVQVDGRLMSATLVQDAAGKHMVYIGEPGQNSSGVTPDGRPKPPKDYLGLALFSLICCCFPLGVVALVKSLEVQRRYSQGDYAGAQKASRLAYKWGSAAVMFGVAFLVIFVVLKLYFEDRHVRQYYY